MTRPGSHGSTWTDPLHLAAMAIDEAQGHLRDYADATDDPAPEAVEAADCVDAIMALLASIERKVELMPQVASRCAADPLYGGSSAAGGGDGRR